MKRVEQYLDLVVVRETGVSNKFAGVDLGRLGIECPNGKVHVLVVKQDSNLGLLACGFALDGFLLPKIRDHSRLFPRGFVENAVDLYRFGGSFGFQSGFDLRLTVVARSLRQHW